MILVILLYAFVLITVVILKLPFSLHYEDMTYNLIIFNTIRKYENIFPSLWSVTNLIGNIIPFVILGILLKATFNWNFLFVCAVIYAGLVIIELLQLILLLGTFDVDDIWLNLVSVIVGYLSKRKKDTL